MKTESKHTKGPWEVSDWNPQLVRSVDGGKHIAILNDQERRPRGNKEPQPEPMANARLIAAAPELLEALKGYIAQEDAGRTPGTRSYSRAGNVALAAIAKAEGR